MYKEHSGPWAGQYSETLSLIDEGNRFVMIEKTYDPSSSVSVLTRYQHPNHQGSTTLETDESGNIITYEEYHPFGTTSYQATNGSVTAAAKRYRYTGMERDDETGLEYHNARYYIPWLGRWMNCDPIGIGDGVNVYVYCKNNPVGNVDSSGTQFHPIDHAVDKVKNSQQDNLKGPIPINSIIMFKKTADTAESYTPPLLAATGGGSANASPAGAKNYAQKTANKVEHNKTTQELRKIGSKLAGPEPKPEEPDSSSSGKSNIFFGIVGIALSFLAAATGVGLPFVVGSMIYSADMIGAGVTQQVTGKETAPIFQQLPTKFGRDILGLDKEESKIFGAVVHAGLGFALGGKIASKANKKITFYTVQDTHDASRLKGTGIPWPTSTTRAHFGPGVYAWDNLADAKAYQSLLNNRIPDLEIMTFSIKETKLMSFKTLNLNNLSQDAVENFLQSGSKLWQGEANHGLDYIIRGTGNFGNEHFFSNKIFNDLKF